MEWQVIPPIYPPNVLITGGEANLRESPDFGFVFSNLLTSLFRLVD